MVGIFLIPVFYVLMQTLSERLWGVAKPQAATPPKPASEPSRAAPP
jgi:hypothetical protein